MRRFQHGVALITLLLIMGLALLLVGGLLRGHRLLTQSTAQQVHQLQMRQWALSGEALARQLLARHQVQPWRAVNLGQAWAGGDLSLEAEEGVGIRLTIEDLGGRFNLGPLRMAGRPDAQVARRWARMTEQLQLPPIEVAELAAGDVFDISRLRHMPAMDGPRLQRLAPWLAVLPRTALLNINTAPAQVLASLGMPVDVARQVVALRPVNGYDSVQAFLDQPLLARLGLSAHGLGLSSDWFRATVQVSVGEQRLRLVSDLAVGRDRRSVQVVQRRLLTPLDQETLP